MYEYQLARLQLSLSFGDYKAASKDVSFCFSSDFGRKQCPLIVKSLEILGLNKQADWLNHKLENNSRPVSPELVGLSEIVYFFVGNYRKIAEGVVL